jgi:hypothetical protein
MGSSRDFGNALIWVAVCFISILLHEMGHVFALRCFGVDAEAALYGFGGLAIPQRDVNGVVPRVLVALAGPVAGFCLAGLNMVAIVGRVRVAESPRKIPRGPRSAGPAARPPTDPRYARRRIARRRDPARVRRGVSSGWGITEEKMIAPPAIVTRQLGKSYH